MILRGRNCLVVDSRLEIKVRMDYLRGQSALCGLAFLHCIVENCQEMAINFLRNFQKSFRFAMPECVLVLRGGEKPVALESDRREEVPCYLLQTKTVFVPCLIPSAKRCRATLSEI